jgi:hypothetical protein
MTIFEQYYRIPLKTVPYLNLPKIGLTFKVTRREGDNTESSFFVFEFEKLLKAKNLVMMSLIQQLKNNYPQQLTTTTDNSDKLQLTMEINKNCNIHN